MTAVQADTDTRVLVTAGWKRGQHGILINPHAVWPDGRDGAIVRIGEWDYEIATGHYAVVEPAGIGLAS